VDGASGEILCAKPLSMIDSSATSSGFGLDRVGTSGGDKLPESSQKKCSSSHDSHSVEQMDSASESDRKFREEIMQPESSSHVRPLTSPLFWFICCIVQYLLRPHDVVAVNGKYGDKPSTSWEKTRDPFFDISLVLFLI